MKFKELVNTDLWKNAAHATTLDSAGNRIMNFNYWKSMDLDVVYAIPHPEQSPCIIVCLDTQVGSTTKNFAGGHLRYINGEWRDDNGDIVKIREEKEGQWELNRTYSWIILTCSECGAWFQLPNCPHEADDYHFCPKCGTRMKF